MVAVDTVIVNGNPLIIDCGDDWTLEAHKEEYKLYWRDESRSLCVLDENGVEAIINALSKRIYDMNNSYDALKANVVNSPKISELTKDLDNSQRALGKSTALYESALDIIADLMEGRELNKHV